MCVCLCVCLCVCFWRLDNVVHFPIRLVSSLVFLSSFDMLLGLCGGFRFVPFKKTNVILICMHLFESKVTVS